MSALLNCHIVRRNQCGVWNFRAKRTTVKNTKVIHRLKSTEQKQQQHTAFATNIIIRNVQL